MFPRLFITAICSLAVYYFVYWVPFSLILPNRISDWVPLVGSAVCSLGVGWYVWRSLTTGAAGLVSSVLLGAVVVGGVSFVAGFFGPMIFAPEANQGPLLGLFITGPLGAVVGAVGGGVLWLARCRRGNGRPHEEGRYPTSG